MDRTNIYLERRQTEMLDRLATEEGVSRAELIRRLLDQALGGRDDNLEADLSAIDRSFGALRDPDVDADVDVEVEVVDRGPRDRADHLVRMWRQR